MRRRFWDTLPLNCVALLQLRGLLLMLTFHLRLLLGAVGVGRRIRVIAFLLLR